MMDKKELEIMAPAGNFECLQAAIQGGADSVYFGVGKLNMRSHSANNFAPEDLQKVVEICRKAGVKSYLTLNICLYPEDIEDAREALLAAKQAGVSAVIASDMAAILMCREIGLEVHISTQLSISNAQALKFYAQWADVVVLARELNLGQVKSIYETIVREQIKGPSGQLVRIEMFAHGALCMAISGKCYLSLHAYGASANRGACYQICRRGYEVTDLETGNKLDIENKYIMSPKDLCTIEFMDKIIDAGVKVFKIEGRARSAEYVKGKVPKRGIYITNTLAKAAFLIFILFSLTIAMRNITQIYNTFHAAEFCSQKTKGYVTVPLNNVNSGRAPEGADYLAFYYATVDRYNGILMAANDFNYDLFEGKMLGEAYGQDYAHINRNYLAFNPIYAPDGEQIGDALLSDTHVNILLPKSKEYRRDEVRERGASWGNSGDVNIVLYDDKASDIYSYNASTGLGGNGALPAPILVVKEGDLLDGLFIEAWCSQGAYFLYVPTDDPYAELLPILRETGIDAATVSTPTVAATFDKMLHHLTYMLMIWGVQALVLLIGLFCLILFGARLYCDNYRDRIACRLIEGHSLLSCIRTHLVLTVLYYGAVAAGLLLLKLAIELDYNILLGTLLAELLITLLACGSIARKNLYQIVKGAEA